MLKQNQKVTEKRTGKTGIYLGDNLQTSIGLVYVKWDNEQSEGQICKSLLTECQFNVNKIAP